MHKGVVHALLAALSFGASTPFAKALLGDMSPVMLAALLYLGSGIGLLTWFGVRLLRPASRPMQDSRLTRPDVPWLAGAVMAGGIAGPVLLMFGLQHTPASSASLLLNLEGVLTALLAWFVFRENFDRRIFLGMALIVTAGLMLAWEQRPALGMPWAALAIVGACLCWAVDNNLTRKIAASDPVQIAAIKGLVAGSVNLGIALALGFSLPALPTVLQAMAVGLCGYGASLVMFVLALRHLGTARTGAYFSCAPFFGAAISLVMFRETPGSAFLVAAGLMSIGIWLHLTERHAHDHTHQPLSHSHLHTHDAHHRHEHDFEWDPSVAHAHPHQHRRLTHSHPHFPDTHHIHRH